METLRGQAVEEGSGSALQSWLGEGGGTWSDATVVDVEAEVMQEVALTREASSGEDCRHLLFCRGIRIGGDVDGVVSRVFWG